MKIMIFFIIGIFISFCQGARGELCTYYNLSEPSEINDKIRTFLENEFGYKINKCINQEDGVQRFYYISRKKWIYHENVCFYEKRLLVERGEKFIFSSSIGEGEDSIFMSFGNSIGSECSQEDGSYVGTRNVTPGAYAKILDGINKIRSEEFEFLNIYEGENTKWLPRGDIIEIIKMGKLVFVDVRDNYLIDGHLFMAPLYDLFIDMNEKKYSIVLDISGDGLFLYSISEIFYN